MRNQTVKTIIKSKSIVQLLAVSICSIALNTHAANVTSIPAGYKDCAKDFGKCNVSGRWTGYYGANSTFVEISGTGSFTCLPGDLKVADPVPNVQKTCYFKTGTSNFAPADHKACAKDFGKCDFTGAWTGYYGANSTFVEISGTGSFTCLPGDLKVADPVPNVQKTCFVKASAAAAPSEQPVTAAAPATTASKCPTKKSGEGLAGYYLQMNDLAKFKVEIEKGANPDIYFSGSGLPERVLGNVTGMAAYNCKIDFLKVLIDRCADLNASYPNAKKPLDLAKMANGGQGCPEAITLLEKAGATVTPAAPPQPKTYPSLVMAATEADYDTMKAMIASKKWDIELTSSRGETALTIAVGYGNLGAVKALLEAGANANQILKGGDHSLHLLVMGAADANGDLRIVKDAEKIAKALWEKCIFRRPRNALGKTPMEMLERRGKGRAGPAEYGLAITLKAIEDGPFPGSKCP